MNTEKRVHTLVLDAGAIIRNEPPVSTLISHSESLVTVPAIISELKDSATRSRVDTTLRPFLDLRSPSPSSIKFVIDFARRTGDLPVLSKPDIQVIALTYEVECELNGGDWRLRRSPGQKGLNGTPPAKDTDEPKEPPHVEDEHSEANHVVSDQSRTSSTVDSKINPVSTSRAITSASVPSHEVMIENNSKDYHNTASVVDDLVQGIENSATIEDLDPQSSISRRTNSDRKPMSSCEDLDSDSEGWITPSNLAKRQADDAETSTIHTKEPSKMQAAVMTSDFAMQNVILQMNLNLLSTSLARVKHLKTFVLRCHACFQVTKDMAKQFCPRCGQPTLTRVSCSTNMNGEFKLHLKKNMQWNTRGDKYSIPKPVHGSANGRLNGGGKGGWGNDLILAEDQKEYQTASREERRRKERSLMDEDYLPGILTGERGKTSGKVKVGAGRNVNSRKR